MDARAWDSLTPSQLRQAGLDLPVEAFAESLPFLPQFKPFQERFGLIFIQAFDFLHCQFDAAHANTLAEIRGGRNVSSH
jgi:hypothetical protein